MTLIELLIVIVIITTLVAAAIPLLAPTSSDRNLREAARGVNMMAAASQARAIAQNRPIGFAIERQSRTTNKGAPVSSTNPFNDNAISTRIYMVEQPPPYAGFDETSSARVALDVDNGGNVIPGQVKIQFAVRGLTQNDGLPSGWDPEGIPPSMYKPGDTIEINGNRFLFTDATNDIDNGYYEPIRSNDGSARHSLVARLINDSGQLLNFIYDDLGNRIGDLRGVASNQQRRYWTEPMPYRVLRQPVPTSDQPFQMPDGTVIDLRASSIGDNDFFYLPAGPTSSAARVDNADGVMVMFAPEGRVWRVYFNRAPTVCTSCNEAPVVDNIYLMVGTVPLLPSADEDPTLDTTNPKWTAAQTESQRQTLKDTINWLRDDSLWIVVGATSGRIATIGNELVDPAAIYGLNLPPRTPEQRRTAQILESRKQTRDARQLGGR